MFKNSQDEYDTLEKMEKQRGSFVHSLAITYRFADAKNKLRLLDAFYDYFSNYSTKKEGIKESRWFRVTMHDVINEEEGKIDHELSLSGNSSLEGLKHMFIHLLADTENYVGIVLRDILKLGKPLSEGEARELLGDDTIDYIKIKAEKILEESKEKLPN